MADGGGIDVAARDGDVVRLAIANESDHDGTVEVVASSQSEAARTRATVATVALPAGDGTEIEVDPALFELPSGTFEVSGSLVIEVSLTTDDGATSNPDGIALFFHPVEDGWRIYDQQSRDRNWNGGALGEDAAFRLELARERLPEGTIWSITRAPTGQGADAALPAVDGPADPDGEEAVQ